MNCKPGDLARIVKSYDTEHLGKIIQVHECCQQNERQGWTHSPSLPLGDLRTPSQWIDDDCLRPLRCDLQTDAVDTALVKLTGSQT